MFKKNVPDDKSRNMKKHYTYAGYLTSFRKTDTQKKKKNNFASIDKASLTVHPCVHND